MAFGLFSIVLLIASGALLSIVDLNKKAQAQQSAINNINFALENMARSIRTGSAYRCNTLLDTWTGSWDTVVTQDCADINNGGPQIIFESEKGNTSSDVDQWSYWIENNAIYTKKTIEGAHLIARITAPEIVIEDMKFFVTGAQIFGGAQPLVRIIIKGYAFVSQASGNNPRRVDFNLQTLASQRKLDI